MPTLSDALSRALHDHGIAALDAERRALRATIAKSRRELAEVSQKISLWDRIVFFSDTPDEARAGSIERRLADERLALARCDEQLAAAFDQLAATFPPFAIARRLARCFELAHDGLEIRGVIFAEVAEKDDLTAALDDIGGRIASTWLPDFDAEALFAALDEEGEARRAADRLRPAASDAHDGHAALTMDQLAPRVARRLLDNGFFAARARLVEDHAAAEARRAAWQAADAAVSWGATLNVLSQSPEERARELAQSALQGAQQRLATSYHQDRALLQDALRAYPPLDVYQAVLECVGVLGLVKRAKEPVVTTSGKVRQRSVVRHAPLLIAALRRLEEAYERAFPEVPRPDELVVDGEPLTRIEPSAVEALCDALDGDDAALLVRRALAHAVVRGQDLARLSHVKKKISWLDRLVFWRKTEAEAEAGQLSEREAWNATWIEQLSDELLQVAQRLGGASGPFAVRDGALLAIASVAAIHTDGGSSSVPRSCSVYGRGEALDALGAIRKALDHHYGVGTNRAALMRDVHAALASTPAGYGFEHDATIDPLPHDEVVRRVAARLKESDFGRLHQQLGESRHARAELTRDKGAVEARISFWDKVNIFSKTPDERRRDELKRELAHLTQSEREGAERVHALFEGALTCYPPAALAFELAEVIDAVEEISAVCRAYTVSTGQGKDRRTETRYRCQLLGHAHAKRAMTRWAAWLTKAFGALPGYREVLERWQLRGWDISEGRERDEDEPVSDDENLGME